MKKARASQQDLEAAMVLRGILSDVFENRWFPRGADGEFDPEQDRAFDEKDFNDLRALYERLAEVMAKGGLDRVIGGMWVLCDPKNALIDPDVDYLSLHPALKREVQERPWRVCLCGSTRFGDAFQAANLRETLAGNIVLTIGCNMKSDEALGLPEDTKAKLDELHLRKIDLADEVLILNVGGYIGESTARELAYAREHGKTVRFLEPQPEGKADGQ